MDKFVFNQYKLKGQINKIIDMNRVILSWSAQESKTF